MGIVNVTPDSFYDGGKYTELDVCLKHIETLIKDGADIIDIGAQSTRPGAKKISRNEEVNRLEGILSVYSDHFETPLSVDTTRSEVAEFALDCGADMINDISGLTFDPRLASIIAKYQATLVIMHIQGTPKTMQTAPNYANVIEDIKTFFSNQIKLAKQEKIENIILDPGIGFGKTLAHNIEILKKLKEFEEFNYPLLIGTSNKSFIDKIHPSCESERLPGTLISNIIAYRNGANIFRVHDVKSLKQAFAVYDTLI